MLFNSFFLGGFECSTHRLRNGRRLDLVAATRHDQYIYEDYQRFRQFGLATARDGVRWHLVEPRPHQYDFSSLLPMLRAAREYNVQIIWDLFHYGWPDDIDMFAPDFLARFANYARATAKVIAAETEGAPFYTPINEISFMAWAGGEVGHLNPFSVDHGAALKAQLVRATIAATQAIRDVDPRARFVQIDPLINIVPDLHRPQDRDEAEHYRQAQFQSWDMLCGRLAPELGGAAQYLDIVGVNYYHNNQWIHNRTPLDIFHPQYVPLRDLLLEVYTRYRRPLFISETGCEGEMRHVWLRYICDEVERAMDLGVPIEGICLYPILDHPGWDDNRYCANGLWGYADERGKRASYAPYADELRRQIARFTRRAASAEQARSVGER